MNIDSFIQIGGTSVDKAWYDSSGSHIRLETTEMTEQEKRIHEISVLIAWKKHLAGQAATKPERQTTNKNVPYTDSLWQHCATQNTLIVDTSQMTDAEKRVHSIVTKRVWDEFLARNNIVNAPKTIPPFSTTLTTGKVETKTASNVLLVVEKTPTCLLVVDLDDTLIESKYHSEWNRPQPEKTPEWKAHIVELEQQWLTFFKWFLENPNTDIDIVTNGGTGRIERCLSELFPTLYHEL